MAIKPELVIAAAKLNIHGAPYGQAIVLFTILAQTPLDSPINFP